MTKEKKELDASDLEKVDGGLKSLDIDFCPSPNQNDTTDTFVPEYEEQ